jgi:hypothetical protein
MSIYRVLSRRYLAGVGRGKGKDTEGGGGWKYTAYMHMKAGKLKPPSTH